MKEKIQQQKLTQIKKIQEQLENISKPDYSLQELEHSKEIDIIRARLDELKTLARMNSLL